MDQFKFFSKAIAFVNELSDSFSSVYPNIRLYYKLMNKTPVSNTNAIQKHNDLIIKYLNANKEAIKTKDSSLLNESISTKNIIFNDKVYINLTECIKQSDPTTKNIIFNHLLLLSYIADPTNEWRELVKQSFIDNSKNKKAASTNSSTTNSANEFKFLDEFKDKIQEEFEDKEFSDPMSAALSMIQSGFFTDMIQGMSSKVESGEIDAQKLLGSVQGMLGNLTGGNLDLNNILSGQASNIEIPSEDGEKVNIDMSQMFSMVGSVMNSMNIGGGDSTNNGGGNPLGLMSTVLPALTSGSSVPNIDDLEEQMKKASLDDINSNLD